MYYFGTRSRGLLYNVANELNATECHLKMVGFLLCKFHPHFLDENSNITY